MPLRMAILSGAASQSGAPTDYYTHEEAKNAILQAEAIIEFCRHQID